VVATTVEQMARAMKHAHRYNVTMCDHKLDNTVIGFGAGGRLEVKIIDLGAFARNDSARKYYV
jgi:hypothetical protein